MHSYIIVGVNEKTVDNEISRLTKKLKLTPFEFSLAKISDVRELGAITKLSAKKRTGIIIKGIDLATAEALNAFLKNLEEPPKNIFYILTASSIYGLLPTIISRCQIIKIAAGNQEISKIKTVQTFIKKSTPEKLFYVGEFRKRNEAVSFIEEFLLGCHGLLQRPEADYPKLSKFFKSANYTLSALKANGNVNLQLTSFVLSLN